MLEKYIKQCYINTSAKKTLETSEGSQEQIHGYTRYARGPCTQQQNTRGNSQANRLNKHFALLCWLKRGSQDRHILKRLQVITQNTNMTPPFTKQMISETIGNIKSTYSPGPDGISNFY